MNNVNLQIYSFGFDCGLSFLDKIRKAGELGYAGVELVRDYEGIPAQDVVNALKEAGIPAVSAHVGLDFIEQDLPRATTDEAFAAARRNLEYLREIHLID